MDAHELTNRIKQFFKEAGFNRTGVANTGKPDHSSFLAQWLQTGNHGAMSWMERYLDKRLDIARYFPGVRSVVMVAQNYYTPVKHSNDRNCGKISRYAWGRDYHKIIKKKLKMVLRQIQQENEEIDGRLFVDTAPVQEKLWAQQAGIGWQGKHTNIISREFGSWIFLGGIALNIELEYDRPAADHCGNCTACIDACPTDALRPYQLDARRCISYLTIENKDERLPEELADKLDNWIFGCDICQQVCPWNGRSRETDEPRYFPDEENIAPRLKELTQLKEEDFKRRFGKSPVARARYPYFLRNIEAVLKANNKQRA